MVHVLYIDSLTTTTTRLETIVDLDQYVPSEVPDVVVGTRPLTITIQACINQIQYYIPI